MLPQPSRSPLLNGVQALAAQATTVYAGTSGERAVGDIVQRLRDPLRVAIAGRLKSGKSTLVNALIGAELAATDAGECTKIVTWYQFGPGYRVVATTSGGTRHQVPFERDGALRPDFGEIPPSSIERLTVEWPIPALETMTLIDTPGMGSLTGTTSARTIDFLTPDDEESTPSDAVIYLTRHLHASDVDFLQTFHEDDQSQPSPVDCIGVLSRADEIAVGRTDPLVAARRVADRYSADPRLRRLVQVVVPVTGLLAQAGTSLTEDDYQAFRLLAALEPAVLDDLLLSVDRFVTGALPGGPSSGQRARLLDRFGMYGVRLAAGIVRLGGATSASQLANVLVDHSGIGELRRVLFSQFTERRDLLKARSGLLALQRVMRTVSAPGSEDIAARLDQLRSGAHELAELRVLAALRVGDVDLRADQHADIERLLGMSGVAPRARLGLPPEASIDEIRAAIGDAMTTWRRRAEHPMASRAAADAARVVVRTCEGLIMLLPPG